GGRQPQIGAMQIGRARDILQYRPGVLWRGPGHELDAGAAKASLDTKIARLRAGAKGELRQVALQPPARIHDLARLKAAREPVPGIRIDLQRQITVDRIQAGSGDGAPEI